MRRLILLPESELPLNSPPVIRNIIFDWSGTLVDDLPAVWKATNYVLARARCAELTLDKFRAEFCLPFTIFYDRYVPHVPLPQLETWFHRRLRQEENSVREVPHAREFLEFCRARRLRTFLLSTVHRRHFAAQESVTGFGKFLKRAYIEVRDKRTKIRELLEENGLLPGETLLVGDMQHDIETARHGGVRSCAVLTGYNTLEQLRRAAPDVIVEHLGELRDLLERNHPVLNRKPRAGGPAETLREQGFPTPTVGALIFNRSGKVLMIRTHKWSDLWGIPGGKIKWGESSVAALRREIREETNLRVTGVEFVLAQDCIHSKEFYRDAHFILLNYTCRCMGRPRVKLNEEGREFRWVTPAQARAMPLNRPTRILLQAVAGVAKRRRPKQKRGKHVENQHR